MSWTNYSCAGVEAGVTDPGPAAIRPLLICLMGPTASGKTALAIELARSTGAAILNADSMQVYSDLRIVTARPSPVEEAAAEHRLYGLLSGSDPCSVARWVAMVKA